MDLLKAMEERHSVRSYTTRPIEADKAAALRDLLSRIDRARGLHFQLQTDEPGGFSGMMAKYGSFADVRNYVVLAGPEGMDREVGYYGEMVVLTAQALGLRTCWVALTYNKRKAVFDLLPGEKLYVVLALGYGDGDGKPHKNRPVSDVADLTDAPAWFRKGIEAVMLAPTAINQQKFRFALDGDRVISLPGSGILTEMDMGIAQYHFDLATDGDHFGLPRTV